MPNAPANVDQEARDSSGYAPAVLLALAAVCIGTAIHLKDGEYSRGAIIWVTAAIALCAAGIIGVPYRAAIRPLCERHAPTALFAALLMQLALLLTSDPSVDVPDLGKWSVLWFDGGIFLTGILAIGLISHRSKVRRRAGLLLVALYLVIGVGMLRHAPSPRIDVFAFQQDASRALLDGKNPYTIRFPDIYNSTRPGSRQVYGPGLSNGETLLFGYPYPPLSLYFDLAAYVTTGDHRYAQLVAVALAALLMMLSSPTRLGGLAAAIFLFTPRTAFVLTRGWTEPFLVLLLALTVFCAIRRPRLLAIAAGLFLASKQYLIFAVPLLTLLLPRPLTRHALVRLLWPAALTGAAVTLPLAAWNLRAFYHSTVVVQQIAPYRTDALSYTNAWLDLRHLLPPDGSLPLARTIPSVAIAFAALLASLILSLWRCPRHAGGFAAGVAFTYLLFIAFNKQAFANYYYFAIGALCCAAAAWPRHPIAAQE